ncbi:MAG TPA: carbonate dehydratase [Xanthomonadaceae bacterium]|nr:carbonate dehydratase [Xanthomonadaceae bacterium]
MSDILELLQRNRAWAEAVERDNPSFFPALARQQTPKYLWIGCSDSRVPANQIVGLQPGEVFVHRNVANQVVPADLNCLSVIQFAVEWLKVEHIIVCGHYGCGGVQATMKGTRLGLVDNWLHGLGDIMRCHVEILGLCEDEDAKVDRLCELNVLHQVVNVCQTTVVRDAWARGQALSAHGWIYGLSDGRIRDLGVSIAAIDDIDRARDAATAAIRERYG